MFTEIDDETSGPLVTFTYEGREIRTRAGRSVTAALLAAGETATRETPVGGKPRGPYCLMGVCFDCLLVIDGEANQQGCMTVVRDGMRVERQRGAAQITPGDGA